MCVALALSLRRNSSLRVTKRERERRKKKENGAFCVGRSRIGFKSNLARLILFNSKSKGKSLTRFTAHSERAKDKAQDQAAAA